MHNIRGWVPRTVRLTWALLALAAAHATAHAQSPVRLALFKTASEDTQLAELAAAIDSVLLSELARVPQLQIVARPALDLPSLQLAIDCVGESAECLALAAKQAEAESLLGPGLRRLGDETVVTLLLYDASQQVAIKAVTRRYSGATPEKSALDGIAGMVNELFQLAADSGESAPLNEVAAPAVATDPQPSAAKPLPLLPIVLGAAGVAFLGAGVGLGLAANGSEDDYAKLKVKDGATATQALDKLDSAKTQAILCNIGLGVGVAALAAAVALFILDPGAPPPEHARANRSYVRLELAPDRLELSGTWD